MINILARVPAHTGGGRHNIFPVKAVIKVVVVRSKPAYSDYLFSRQWKMREPRLSRGRMLEKARMIVYSFY